MSLLEVNKLKAGYGKKIIVNGISLKVMEGEIVGILGPNGCGKSTMLKALCKGLSFEGEAKVSGQDIKEMSEKDLAKICSYVPQRSGLSIDISALEVVLMGFYPYMGVLERTSKEMKEKAVRSLSEVGLQNEINSNYMELSEGQKRMCILARSLVAEAKLLLMDEPDASLDFGVRNNLMQIILERVKEKKAGVLLSLHDISLALTFCDRIYLMNNGSFTDEIKPKEDTISDMENKLFKIYGKVKLLEYSDESNTRKVVMVKA